MKNRVTTYLLYAIGEIFLVVIGILIAVSIDNWNERRINRERELATLDNLNKEFSENLVELESNIEKLDSLSVSLAKILALMHDGPEDLTVDAFEVLLEKTFYTPSWTPSSFIIEELKNSGGLSQLSDPKLRNLLFDWERGYENLILIHDGYNIYANQYIRYLTDFGSVRNLDVIDGGIKSLKKSTIARNDITMLKEPRFENRVDNYYFMSNSLKDKYQAAAQRMRVIIKQTSVNR